MGNAVTEELKDLFTPTERAFKGLAIIFFIYGAASMLACVLIS